MATRNNIKDLFETTPAAIFDSVEELIFQNEKNFKAGRRKQAMQIIGSPGIGKTECLEVYPAKKLAKDNTEIIKPYTHYEFVYKSSLPFKEQTIEQLDKLVENEAITEAEKKELLKKLKLTPDVAVVVVRQSDIILPEDISGLPSSESEIAQMKNIYALIGDNKKFSEYRILIENKIESLLKNVFHKEDITDSDDLRNTTKFDFTEWEHKVHELAKDENIKSIILVMDDITRSANNNPSILNVLMPIFQQYTVGQRELPANCSVIITSNEAESDSGKFNYVVDLDEAQQDRLLTKYIKFTYADWEAHAMEENVHDSVILFTKYNQEFITKHHITPRRLTQLGHALYNKFGHSQDFISGDAESQRDFMKTIDLQLGDSKNENYKQVLNALLAFLKNTSSDAIKVINEIREKGWKSARPMVEGYLNKGEMVKVSIIMHKIRDLCTKEQLKEKELNAFIDVFNDTLIPLNLRFTALEIAKEMVAAHHKIKTGSSAGKAGMGLYMQLVKVLEGSVESIAKQREEIKAAYTQRVEKKGAKK